MMDSDEPVWITGVGAATPLGCELAEIESNLLAGRSGSTRVTRFPTDDYPSRIAAQVGSVPARRAATRRVRGEDPARSGWRAWCVESALRDAGLWGRHREARVGLVLGLGAEWMLLWETDDLAGGDAALRTRTRTANRRSSGSRRELGLSGPALALSAACASGNHALEIGPALAPAGPGRRLRRGRPATWRSRRSGWRRSATCGPSRGGTTTPAAASRPFDRGRDGFVLGEGGVAFVLERSGDARRRSAAAYAEVAGCGSSSDAHHHVIPSPDPSPAAAAIRRALADARIDPDEVDHVNAHATSTPVGDAAEAAVLRIVLGDDADRIPVTSTKSLTGHLLTAAGAVRGPGLPRPPCGTRPIPPDDQPRRARRRPLPGRQRGPAASRSASPSPTRSASAAATPAWCSGRCSWTRNDRRARPLDRPANATGPAACQSLFFAKFFRADLTRKEGEIE